MCKYVLKRRKSLTLLPVSPGMLSVAGCPLGLIRQQRGFEAEEHKPGGQGYEGQQKGGYGMKGCREEEDPACLSGRWRRGLGQLELS